MHFTRIVMFYEKIDHAFADHLQIKSNNADEHHLFAPRFFLL